MSILEFTFKNEYAADIVYSYLKASNMELFYTKDKKKVILNTNKASQESLDYVLSSIKQSKIPVEIKEGK